MHPHAFYANLFFPIKREEIFVIMSFDSQFEDRWNNLYVPAIERDLNLKANRVDYNISGDSTIHDILDSIAHAKYVIADITSVQMTDASGICWPQRNANVMWEPGIAHLMRLPDEVLILRSDEDESIFDLTQFRVFNIDPADVAESRRLIRNLIRERAQIIDQTKCDYVKQAVESLDPISVNFLLNNVPFDGSEIAIIPNMQNALSCPRLYDLGILKTSVVEVQYRAEGRQPLFVSSASITSFGKDVVNILAEEMGFKELLYKAK